MGLGLRGEIGVISPTYILCTGKWVIIPPRVIVVNIVELVTSILGK